jgi:hypothetical protein
VYHIYADERNLPFDCGRDLWRLWYVSFLEKTKSENTLHDKRMFLVGRGPNHMISVSQVVDLQLPEAKLMHCRGPLILPDIAPSIPQSNAFPEKTVRDRVVDPVGA